MTVLAVSEIFGPTIQGEGPSCGRQAMFLRLAMCNLKCIWCDTKYTWDWQHYNKLDEVDLLTLQSVASKLNASNHADLLVITGGEPMLQQRGISKLFDIVPMSLRFGQVEIETNGTVEPRWLENTADQNLYFNVSPKLSNSGNDAAKRKLHPAYADLWYARFKFVCATVRDLQEVEAVCSLNGINHERVWIMPLGSTRKLIEENEQYLADYVIRAGFNMTTRLHIKLWGNERGR